MGAPSLLPRRLPAPGIIRATRRPIGRKERRKTETKDATSLPRVDTGQVQCIVKYETWGRLTVSVRRI